MKDFNYYSTSQKPYPTNEISKQLKKEIFSIMETFVGTKKQIE